MSGSGKFQGLSFEVCERPGPQDRSDAYCPCRNEKECCRTWYGLSLRRLDFVSTIGSTRGGMDGNLLEVFQAKPWCWKCKVAIRCGVVNMNKQILQTIDNLHLLIVSCKMPPREMKTIASTTIARGSISSAVQVSSNVYISHKALRNGRPSQYWHWRWCYAILTVWQLSGRRHIQENPCSLRHQRALSAAKVDLPNAIGMNDPCHLLFWYLLRQTCQNLPPKGSFRHCTRGTKWPMTVRIRRQEWKVCFESS